MTELEIHLKMLMLFTGYHGPSLEEVFRRDVLAGVRWHGWRRRILWNVLGSAWVNCTTSAPLLSTCTRLVLRQRCSGVRTIIGELHN